MYNCSSQEEEYSKLEERVVDDKDDDAAEKTLGPEILRLNPKSLRQQDKSAARKRRKLFEASSSPGGGGGGGGSAAAAFPHDSARVRGGGVGKEDKRNRDCLLYTSPSPRD